MTTSLIDYKKFLFLNVLVPLIYNVNIYNELDNNIKKKSLKQNKIDCCRTNSCTSLNAKKICDERNMYSVSYQSKSVNKNNQLKTSDVIKSEASYDKAKVSKLYHPTNITNQSKSVNKNNQLKTSDVVKSEASYDKAKVSKLYHPKLNNDLYLKFELGHIAGTNIKDVDDNYFKDAKVKNPITYSIELGKRINNTVLLGASYHAITHNINNTVQDIDLVGDNIPGGYTYVEMPVKSRLLIANMYYEYPKFNDWKPYLIIGAGAARNITLYYKHNIPSSENEVIVKEQSDHSLALRVALGFNAAISSHFSVDCAINYFNFGSAITSDNATIIAKSKVNDKVYSVNNSDYITKIKLSGYAITLGLRYNF